MNSTPEAIKRTEREMLFLSWIHWAVLGLLIAFVGLNLASSLAESTEISPTLKALWGWIQGLRPWLLASLLTTTALWFIACFTGDAEKKLHASFVFAYAFTFGAFALLVTPFVGSDVGPSPAPPSEVTAKAPLRPTEGVLQLVRGCLREDAAGGQASVSVVTRCPPDSWTESSAAGRAATREVGRQYGWLVSIGGVTVRKYEPVVAGAPAEPKPQSFVEIYGGLAVPMFVVVLAFIGGAVSLSRRIPEYQRRAEKIYVPTESDEPMMVPYQAREAIAFQIMQLVSAPFLAMATWYLVSPATLAAAAGLAFGTGFASEPLLLMIRGMVEGIRPEGMRFSAPTDKNPPPPPPPPSPDDT